MKHLRLTSMLVIGFILFAAVSTLATGSRLLAQDVDPAVQSLSTHTDDRYGFRLDYASPWMFVAEWETGAGHATEFVTLTSAGDEVLHFYVVVRNLSPHIMLEEWLAAERELMVREPIVTRPVTLDGVLGIEHVYSGDEGIWIARYFVRWDKVYLLNYGPVSNDAADIPLTFTWDDEPRLDPVPTLPPNDPFGPPPGDSTAAPTGQPPLQFPFCGSWRISNGYYPNAHPNNQYNKFALDFVATDGVVIGKPIYAAHNGTVSTGWDSSGGGWLSKLTYDGDSSYKTWYAHLNSFTVTLGYVSAGAEIARAGNSGNVTGPHLHFALLQNNVSTKPEPMSGATGFAAGQTHTRNCGGFQCTDVLPVGEGSSRQQLFVDAYNRMGGRARLGCTRGGAYWWHDPSDVRKIVRQDFTGPGGSNEVMITHNETKDSPLGSVPAYVTWGSIYTRYIELGGINSPSIGIPTSDEFVNAAGEPQSNFTNGYITWDGDSFEFFSWPSYNPSQWQIKFFNGRNQDHNREPTWRMNQNTTMIDLNWGEGAPGNGRWGVWADNFSMTAAKSILFDAGRYNFHIQADDGVRLWVDSTLLIDEWHAASGSHYNAEINLTQGTHLIVLAYYEEAGAALVKLDWTKLSPPARPTISDIDNVDRNDNFTINWSVVSTATSYTLQEQFDGGSFSTIYSGPLTSIGRSNRTPGQWCYRVEAVNSAGGSGWSNLRCAAVSGPPARPVINDIDNTDRDGNYIITWPAVSGATSYTLQEQLDGGSFSTIYSGPLTSITITNRTPGQWCYRVEAVNSAGSSGWSIIIRCVAVYDLRPDLLPFAPSGYQYPVVPSAVTGTMVEGTLTAGEETYFDWHFKNAGTAAASDNFHVELWIDGTRHVRYPWEGVGVGAVEGFDDWMEYINTPGSHTVRLVVDPDNVVAESNESNNVWERQFIWNPPPTAAAELFINPAGNGTVGGLTFSGADILRYNQTANTWTMVYDGSAQGTPKNLSAFDLDSNGGLLLVFAANQAIAGLGTATPYDVVRFTPNNPGVFPLGPGSYSWFFQGKPKGLSTAGEKIDALAQTGAWVMLSTSGAAKLPLPNGATLNAADEDVFVYHLANAQWMNSLLIDGSLIPGMAAEDISGVWDDPSTNNFYVTITGAFNMSGVKGNGKSVVKLTANGGASVYTPSLVTWLAPGATFPANVGGIDMGQ